MDVLIMGKMRNDELTGYDIISYIHRKFDYLLSSGTVYSILYSMERDGLIMGKRVNRKRVYNLTQKGEETIKIIYHSNDIFGGFLARFLKSE